MSFHHRPKKPIDYILSEIDHYFKYDPITGELDRFDKAHKQWYIVEPGHNKQVGFRIGRKIIKVVATNICWYIYYKQWPESEIDHKNRNPSDNRIANLKLANRSQQTLNSGVRSGKYLPGVCRNKNGRFQARIKEDYGRRNIHLGCFSTEILAHEAYRRAYHEKHGTELDYPYLEGQAPRVVEIA